MHYIAIIYAYEKSSFFLQFLEKCWPVRGRCHRLFCINTSSISYLLNSKEEESTKKDSERVFQHHWKCFPKKKERNGLYRRLDSNWNCVWYYSFTGQLHLLQTKHVSFKALKIPIWTRAGAEEGEWHYNPISLLGGSSRGEDQSTSARQTDIFFSSRKLSSVFWPAERELLSCCCHKKEKTHLRGHIRSFCQMMTPGSLDSGLAAGIQTCSDETMKTHQILNPIY